ncbi:MAG: SAM-dependent methyltransferase [Bacteroidaceae bacterium]|nr:SAM-dependent methyltransferase [Bacteroidaceae bacterium]
MEPALYLIPVTLGETPLQQVLPEYNSEIIHGIHHFIVEEIRTARRFLKQVDRNIDIDSLHFNILNEHTDVKEIGAYLEPLLRGEPMGVISEAGCPAIADPGADVVAMAQRHNLKVIPLVGPSSILLSLMASGFNGQSFAFNGYLPIDDAKRTARLKELEQRAYTENQTQIFIEAPYRNNNLLSFMLKTLKAGTRICIARNITCSDASIITHTVNEWRNCVPELPKEPAIFLIYK